MDDTPRSRRPDRPLRARPEQTDRRLTITLAFCVLTVVMLVLGTPYVISNSSTTREIQKGDEIAACRSQSNNRVTEANTETVRARVAADISVNHFLDAFINQDRSAAPALAAELPLIRNRLETALDQLEQASADHQTAVRLSQTDPDTFLEMCRSGDFDTRTQETPDG